MKYFHFAMLCRLRKQHPPGKVRAQFFCTAKAVTSIPESIDNLHPQPQSAPVPARRNSTYTGRDKKNADKNPKSIVE